MVGFVLIFFPVPSLVPIVLVNLISLINLVIVINLVNLVGVSALGWLDLNNFTVFYFNCCICSCLIGGCGLTQGALALGGGTSPARPVIVSPSSLISPPNN